MRSICLYFQVHQPFRLRTYRFFNIGDDHQYYDDYQNRHIVRRVADKCYIPANKMMLDLIQEFGSAFKLSISISGTAIEQLANHAPEVLQGFKKLADTGCVEFLAETYSHSLASLSNREEFIRQVEHHSKLIEHFFNQRPTTFRNSELVYSDHIGEMVSDMGFTTMMTEGAKQILGWKSPNYMYCSSKNPKLKLLLRNFRLSDDIAFRFSTKTWPEWPITAEKFTGWLNGIDAREEVVNVFIDYETIGERLWKETGIFEFFKALPKTVFTHSNFTFSTPSELSGKLQPVAPIHVPYPISWADEERDLTSWLGNELQDEAFSKLYALTEKVTGIKDRNIQRDWQFLQTSDHFYYMCTKWFSDGAVHKYFNPYPSPYEAFINYMNVLSDFMIRVDHALSKSTSSSKKMKEVKPGKTSAKLKEKASVAVRSKTVKPVRTRKAATTVTPKEIKQVVRKKENGEKIRLKKVPSISFDDLAETSDRLIKMIIKELDVEVFGSALKGAKKPVREKIEKNFGKRDLKKYQDFIATMKTPDAAEVRKSRNTIIKKLGEPSVKPKKK
jgi:alpha-amylase